MRVIRIGIPLLVAFAVLAHGAVEPWSQAILETGAGLLLVAWALEMALRGQFELRWNALLIPVGGLVALAMVQWGIGITAYVYVTKLATLRMAAELILLFLTIQAFRTPKEWKNLAWFLMSLAFAVSLFGIVQYFTWNGKLYWVRTLHNGGMPFGPFVNRNDFAGFVELILPLGLALLILDGERRERRLLVALFAVFPPAALVLSASRAGIVVFSCELVMLLVLAWVYGRRSQRWLLLGVTVAIAVLASWLGVGYTFARFTGATGTDVSLVQRFQISRDAWQIFLHHPLVGTGMGTLETVFPRFQTHYIALVVNHAHDDYVELLANGGIIGGAFGLAFLLILYRRGIRNLRLARTPVARSLYGGGLVACTGMLIHEWVDFNLHIPSNAIIFLLIACLVTSLIPEPIANPRHPSFRSYLPS
jgi:O-antigen ligase